MNTETLLKHINLDEIIQDRFYSCTYDRTINDINDIYFHYELYNKVEDPRFPKDWFLKYFRNTTNICSQINGTYCLWEVTEDKVILKRFIPKSSSYADWNTNTLCVNKKKFLKYKYEITSYFNKQK